MPDWSGPVYLALQRRSLASESRYDYQGGSTGRHSDYPRSNPKFVPQHSNAIVCSSCSAEQSACGTARFRRRN